MEFCMEFDGFFLMGFYVKFWDVGIPNSQFTDDDNPQHIG